MRLYTLLVVCLLLQACSTQKAGTKVEHSSANSSLVADGKLWSSLFQQRAAEYKALCYQAFNIAGERLDKWSTISTTKPKAIVTDVDETFLDNSPYAVHQALQGKDFESQTWNEWTAMAKADTLAGALTFFNKAAAAGIEVFYVTNRDETERAGTLKNLQRYKFPFADNEHLLLRKDVSSKEPRRQAVASNHEIILFLGDNLSDFSTAFEKKTELERDQQVSSIATAFGTKFIVLPNFSYGGWEDAVYQNGRNWTATQKDSLIKLRLINY